MFSEERVSQLRARGLALWNMALSLGILAADFLWQLGIRLKDRGLEVLPTVLAVVSMGGMFGASLVGAGWVVAKYGQILAIRVEWSTTLMAWAAVAFVWGVVTLGWMILKIVGFSTSGLTSSIQSAAARISGAVATEGRRPPGRGGTAGKAGLPKPKAPVDDSGGSFVAWDEGTAFINEMAETLRQQGMSAENVEETIRQYGRGEGG